MFDKTALTWQWSVGLELFAGAVGIWLSLNAFPAEANLAGAMFVLAVILVAYILRYKANGTYDDAETMRRQAVLSEGMGWELGRAELTEWRNRAGQKIIDKAALNPRPDDYYDNKLGEGAKKLAEMTFESAHWTKCLYRHMRGYLVAVLVAAALIVAVLVAAALFVPTDERTALAYAAFLFAPIVLTVDFLGMVLKLNRAIGELKSLSPHLEREAKLTSPKTGSVMRLVAEYNCVVSSGVPIPNWLWKRYSSATAASWKGK
ncbi:MAG: hypothetical protein Q8R02_04235 [Hyphomonadaceae bacterium]|nr:hypothetical protein [Hyphomonadaceae bacterium]